MKVVFNQVKDTILDIKKDIRNEVYNFGEDNAYPSLIEQLIQGSVTSKACVDKVARSIYGKSFGEAGEIIVNNKGQDLNEVLRLASREYARHNNLYLHVGYNGELKINSIKVLSSKDVRLGKDDDRGYSGKFVVYNNWDKTKGRRIESAQFKVIDRYNPNSKVLQSQIEAAGGIKNYKGQILHIQEDSNELYSPSDLHPVLAEALLEANSQTFRSRGAEKGFLNTKLMVVKKFANEKDKRDFKNSLENLQGADNSGRVLLLESANLNEDLSNQIKLDDLSSNYQDELFKYSDEQAKKNIALAFGVPLGLIDVSDNALFGNSGELLRQMKTILWEQQEEARDMLETAFNKLGKKFAQELPDLIIINPYEQQQAAPETPAE